jgi:SAM-dependent methyltransferase
MVVEERWPWWPAHSGGGTILAGKSSWESFFDAHAPIYDENVFTRNTVAEVDFLLDELAIPPGSEILDVGCGTGRHAIELAGRGYVVTGLDLSSAMLARADSAARQRGVSVEWLQADATRFAFPSRFDAALCLCEGAFGLLGHDDDPIEQPLAILRNIALSLKPQARSGLLWEGTDGQGHRLASGTYLLRLQAEGTQRLGKVVLVR